MRVVKELSHPRFKITVFLWNNKYLVKIEDAHLEQVYKIPESELASFDELEAMISTPFLLRCLERFGEMSADWNAAFRQRYSATPHFESSQS